MLKHFKSAEDHLHEAISLSIIQNLPKKIVQNQLRLADVFRYQNNFVKSEVLFDQARNLLNQTADSENLMASYHQHFGKFYFDQNFQSLAICHFKLALRIRRRLNASVDQINSSMASIAESEKRSNDHIQNDITIRIAEVADAENIHHAHMRSINEICSKDHSVDEIRVR